MKYLLISNNAYNLGDIAIAESTIQHIRSFDKHAIIVLESNDPTTSRKYFNDIEIIPRYFGNSNVKLTGKLLSFGFVFNNIGLVIRTFAKVLVIYIASVTKLRILMPQILKESIAADYILSVCGDSISERYGYFLRFIEIDTITRLNKNFIIYAQSIGPFTGRRVKKWAKSSLSKCTLILARDEKTASLLHEYGITAKIELTADAVISLTPDNSPRALQAIEKFSIDRNTIGLVLRTPILSNLTEEQYRAYLESMTYVVDFLKAKGFKVLMTGTIPEDCATATTFLRDFSIDDVQVLMLYDYKPSEAKYILSKLHSIISPRMHPVILATSMLVPALALIQEFKLDAYMKNIGLSGSSLPLVNIDKKLLASKLENLLARRDQYSDIIKGHLGALTKLSLRNAELLNSLGSSDLQLNNTSFPLVSVIIINWNGQKWLKRCLDTLSNQTYLNIELIMVDNASTDGSVDYVRQEYPVVKVVKSPTNSGFAAGNNLGIEAARGELILLLNNDTWAEPDLVQSLVEEKQRRNLDVIGAREAFYWDSKKRGLYTTPIDPLGHTVSLYPSGSKPIKQSFYLSGVCILFSRKLYVDSGGLDPDFFMYFEEVDWFWRLTMLKKTFDFSDKVQIHHAGSGSTGGKKIKYSLFLWRNQNTLQMLLKNYRWHNLAWVLPLYFLQNIFEIVFFLLILKPKIAFSYIEGWLFNIKHFKRTMRKRRWIQQNRALNDHEILLRMYHFPAKLVHLMKFIKNKGLL